MRGVDAAGAGALRPDERSRSREGLPRTQDPLRPRQRAVHGDRPADGVVRIRAIRPDFWQDDTLGHLSDSVRLFYVGLWCVADDAGWLEWKPAQLGAALYPYRTP